MKQINQDEAVQLIRESNGKVFGVDFIKKDGSLRKINARTGVTSKLAGGKSTIAHKPNLVSCYDMVNSGYRCVNAETIQSVRIAGETYMVVR